MRRSIGVLVMLLSSLMLPAKMHAQAFDPRQPLAILISAFQNCGPPQSYSLLAPNLFGAVYQETSGTGCYSGIQGAGPITGMQMLGAQDFPIGPLYLIRVTHSSGAVADWFVGFNRNTGQVEYLRFQAPQTGQTPSITTGPSPTGSGPSPVPAPQPTGGGGGTGGGGSGGSGSGAGCELYPVMCA